MGWICEIPARGGLAMDKIYSFGFSGTHSVAETIDIVLAAEKVGFDTVWISEDYFQYGAFSLAAACAAHTSRINIGIGVINPYTRHPVLSAMEAVALDEVSQGRMVLGIGSSNKVWMETQTGIPYVKPLTAATECVQIIRQLTSTGTVEFDGDYFKTGLIRLNNQPFRREIPLFLGIKGDKALEAAGRLKADVLLSAGSPVEYVRHARKLIAKGALAAGHDPASIKIAAYLPIYIHQDGRLARESMRPLTAELIGLHGEHPILLTAGITPEEIAPFRSAFVDNTPVTTPVSDELVDKLVIAGTPEECRSRLDAYLAAGVDIPVFFEATGVCSPLDSIHSIKEHLL